MAEELKRLWPNLAQISGPACRPEACWNSSDDNIDRGQKFACLHFPRHGWTHRPTTYSHVSRWHARQLLVPIREQPFLRACLPSQNGANSRKGTFCTANSNASGGTSVPPFGNLVATAHTARNSK